MHSIWSDFLAVSQFVIFRIKNVQNGSKGKNKRNDKHDYTSPRSFQGQY